MSGTGKLGVISDFLVFCRPNAQRSLWVDVVAILVAAGKLTRLVLDFQRWLGG